MSLPEDMTQFEELFGRKVQSDSGSRDSIAQSIASRAPKVS